MKSDGEGALADSGRPGAARPVAGADAALYNDNPACMREQPHRIFGFLGWLLCGASVRRLPR